MKKALMWLLLGGLMAYPIEGLWRIPSNGGWASIYMLPVYGLCLLAVGSINQVPRFYNLSMRLQALIGTIIVLVIELFSGIILNIGLGLGIWDYSDMPFNILGQICLLYGIFWFLLMPFAIWLEDRLNLIWSKAHGEEVEYDYTLKQAYRELLVGAKGAI